MALNNRVAGSDTASRAGTGAGIGLPGKRETNMQQANLITASMLYNHLACPHRVAMDAFGDWNRRDKVSPFVEMLWARGNKYEATVIGGLGEPFVDLSTLTGDEK